MSRMVVRYEIKGEKPGMKRNQIAEIRRHLGKAQSQMTQVLGVPTNASRSFEQGWRKIPVYARDRGT